MKLSRRQFLHLAASTAALPAVSRPARTQTYPDKPVRVVVGFAPGGPTDVVARIVALKLSERLGQQFYVENIPGANGNTGTVRVAHARPDGSTLLVAASSFVINPSVYAKVPYDAVKDFQPITLIATTPNVVTVNPTVPARTLAELVALIRATPGKYSYAQTGTGSSPHLSGELFRIHFNLDIANVPFGGAAPAIGSTIAGHTPVAFTAVQAAIESIKSGQLRALAVTSAKRIRTLPDVPTLVESGVEGQDVESLNALLAPAGTPPHVVDMLYREVGF
jgi:tripartite-type tricarboxylate transporter receptor subunit TctC